jgi:hypothetical protein
VGDYGLKARFAQLDSYDRQMENELSSGFVAEFFDTLDFEK